MCSWDNLLSFSVPWGTEKITESRFARGISYTGWHYDIYIYVYIYIYIYIGFATGKDWGRGGAVKALFVSVVIAHLPFLF